MNKIQRPIITKDTISAEEFYKWFDENVIPAENKNEQEFRDLYSFMCNVEEIQMLIEEDYFKKKHKALKNAILNLQTDYIRSSN